MSDNFAPPVSKLGIPTLGGLDVASSPTGGQGFALPVNGTQPLMLATKGRHLVAFGTVVVTWPGGSATSNSVTVAHGLGVTPVSAVVTPDNSVTFASAQVNLDFTNLTVRLHTTDGSSPVAGSQTTYWIALA